MNARLHSKFTFVQRKLFPLVVVGVVLLSFLPMCFEAPVEVALSGGAVAGTVLLVCGLAYWSLAWPLMDEAVLSSSAIRVRRGRVKVEVPLAKVGKVTSQTTCNPQSVTLHLEMETALGSEISFMAPGRYLWGRPHPLVKQLRDQINQARQMGEAQA